MGSRNTLGAAPEEGWDFDTIRTNPHPPTLHPDHYKGTIRSRSTTSERSVSSALQGLNLNAAPQSGTTETQGRKVSNTAIRINNGKRRRSSTAKKPTEKPTPEQKSQKAIKPEAHKQENPLAPVTDYGKAASTVRQFKRVPDKSPRTSPYGSLQAQNPKVEDGNKVAMRSPTTEEGFMGRQLYSSVVRDTLAEVSVLLLHPVHSIHSHIPYHTFIPSKNYLVCVYKTDQNLLYGSSRLFSVAVTSFHPYPLGGRRGYSDVFGLV